MRTEAFFTPPGRFACPAFGHSRPASAIAGVKERKEVKEMNTLVIVLIAAVCLFGAYTLYGRWLANKWGIDPTAKTPAVVHEDGRDYVPTNGWTVFAHQFSSIAGAGPVTGAIQAAAFGWLPVLLWVLLGGIFFGAVTDFGALYASVKNDGKSMGMLIEKYIGKTGRKLFLLFCWLFCGIVIAAFADMVAGTFNAFGADGALVEAAQTNGAAGMVSIMFMVFAVVFGLIQKKFNFSGWKESVISIVFIVLSFVIGANLPIILGKAAWSYITFVYIFFAAVLPMWLLKQPRDHMTTFMFVAMIAGAVVGLLVAHPTMNLPSDGFVQPFGDSPLDNLNVSETAYMQIINRAHDYVYITTPYLILDNEMVTSLINAAQSGIDVRIITPHVADKWYVHMVTRSYYAQLIRGGVKIYEYTPGFIHSKMFVSDDQVAIVGTANMDYRSFYLHFECGVSFYQSTMAAKVRDDILRTLKVCQPVELDELNRAPLHHRAFTKLLRLMAPLM